MVFDGFRGDVELSLGYVLGVRGFRLDSMGRFTGWSYRSIWTPGQNVAICQRKKLRCSIPYSTYSSHYHGDSCYGLDPCDDDIENCDHGFWAYFEDFDGQGDTLTRDTYPAIIKGYGKTVIGTNGFRSEKAEIVAVAVPWTFESEALPRIQVERNYPDVEVYNTKAEMFESFPAQDQSPKQPTDPRDPDFWTFDPTNKQKIIRRVDSIPAVN